MTYTPIPEERRRELAAFIPDLAEARRRWEHELDAPAEPQFWTEHILGALKCAAFPTNAAERVWLLRHAYLAAVGADPTRVSSFAWPGFCALSGVPRPLEPIPGAEVPPKEPPKEMPGPKPDEYSVVIEGRVVKPGDTIYVKAPAPGDDPKRTVARAGVNPLGLPRVWFTNGYWRDPTDLTFVAPASRRAPSIDHQALGAAYAAQAFDFNKGLTDSDVKRTSLQVFSDYMKRRAAELAMLTATPPILVDRTAFQQLQQFHMQIQAALTPSKLENTMTQATAFNADSLTVDTSNIVETKTFVFGRDITTLDDNDLLGNIQLLDQKIDKLEAINAKTPLVKLVTKIAQLKDAKAKIVELLGGAPVEQASPAIDADETKPKRVRRTKAEIEADNAAQARAEIKAAPIPLTPPPASKVDPDPSADVDDLDLE